MIIKNDELLIIKELENLLGIQLYLVGGAVRDILLGKPIKDWDFTTPAKPEQVEETIKNAGYKTYLIGKKFGTIGFKYKSKVEEVQYIEITTFRSETYLDKSRKPQVEFVTNIQQDLSRRDFTINSMAIKSNLRLIDPFGGQEDLNNSIIRSVGNPKIRFGEDPLRILRAIRFAASLNFTIEEVTWGKLCTMKYELLNISKERWVMEIDKIMGLENPELGLSLLMKSGVLGAIIPEMKLQQNYDQNSPYHDFDLWTHTKKVVSNIPNNEIELRWSALLHDIAKPFTRTENKHGYSNYLNHDILGSEMAKKVCNYLKFSNSRTDFIVENILNHLKPESALKKYDDMSKKLSTMDYSSD